MKIFKEKRKRWVAGQFYEMMAGYKDELIYTYIMSSWGCYHVLGSSWVE